MYELKLIVLVQLSAYCWQGEIIFKKQLKSCCIIAGKNAPSFWQKLDTKLKEKFPCYSLPLNKPCLCHIQVSLQWVEMWDQHMVVSRCFVIFAEKKIFAFWKICSCRDTAELCGSQLLYYAKNGRIIDRERVRNKIAEKLYQAFSPYCNAGCP